MNLLDDTLQKARESEIAVAALADKAQVGKRWLQMVLSGQIADPSVRKVQRVHDALVSDEQRAA